MAGGGKAVFMGVFAAKKEQKRLLLALVIFGIRFFVGLYWTDLTIQAHTDMWAAYRSRATQAALAGRPGAPGWTVRVR